MFWLSNGGKWECGTAFRVTIGALDSRTPDQPRPTFAPLRLCVRISGFTRRHEEGAFPFVSSCELDLDHAKAQRREEGALRQNPTVRQDTRYSHLTPTPALPIDPPHSSLRARRPRARKGFSGKEAAGCSSDAKAAGHAGSHQGTGRAPCGLFVSVAPAFRAAVFRRFSRLFDL